MIRAVSCEFCGGYFLRDTSKRLEAGVHKKNYLQSPASKLLLNHKYSNWYTTIFGASTQYNDVLIRRFIAGPVCYYILRELSTWRILYRRPAEQIQLNYTS
jgi:hypothetical protein